MATEQNPFGTGADDATHLKKVGEMLRVRRARLRVDRGPDQGEMMDIRHHRMVVGSGADCDFVLNDRAASRRHCEIVRRDDGFLVRDLESTNGTFVGGLRINEAVVARSEPIQVGDSTLELEITEEHDEFPLSPHRAFGTLHGQSKVMRQAFAVLERAARSDVTLLIEGESGTGKDLAAENVHHHSPRRDHPFVIVDCSTMTPNLVGSELFGHARGAFTGADRDREGAFEGAEGGTVFLDEIGTLPLGLQPQLLRALERREVRRLGENRYRPVDVRIIAATNQELEVDVREGRFREDLFYRLSVIRVYLPPLRDRREDIPFLARGFVRSLTDGEREPEEVFTDELLGMFHKYDWPGNVRELRNVIERLIVLPGFPTGFTEPTAPGVPSPLDKSNVLSQPWKEWKASFERDYLSSLLHACDGQVARASEASGIPRQTLYRMLHKYELLKK